jgi:acylpyruvate hydrolase
MKFLSYADAGQAGLAMEDGGVFRGLLEGDTAYPGSLSALLAKGDDALVQAGAVLVQRGTLVRRRAVTVLPPLLPGKIICVGLNYADHAAEANLQVPESPTLFSRFASSVIGDGAPIRLPRVSVKLDYEGELAAIIGKSGRYISKADALDHIAGYSVFNDASIRDYQLRTTQWTIGKNFDGTGPFGPVFVTADNLPRGASGLMIQTRLNGVVVQKSSTDQLIFDVPTLVATISEAMTLKPGDVIITGTPSGVGAVRSPPLFMKNGDVCEVEIEGIGTLSNPVAADA